MRRWEASSQHGLQTDSFLEGVVLKPTFAGLSAPLVTELPLRISSHHTRETLDFGTQSLSLIGGPSV